MVESEIEQLSHLRVLMNSSRYDEALSLVDRLLQNNYLSPFLHALKARLIMLSSEECPYTLDDAGDCLLKALEINANDLEVIEELAHYYDIVAPDSQLATRYASLLLDKIRDISNDMAEIINESDVA